MTWREKFNNMAMIDILYMFSDNATTGTTCMRDIIIGAYGDECECDCHKCMENLLNEECCINDIHKQS